MVLSFLDMTVFFSRIWVSNTLGEETSHLPNIITRQPFCTNSSPSPLKAIHGVLMPCISNTFLPSSGPHSYTRILPKGVSTSLAPSRASGAQGSLFCCSFVRVFCISGKGESMVRHGACMLLRYCEVKSAVSPTDATAPIASNLRSLAVISIRKQ